MAAKHYDCIVVGAGQAGGPLSTALAKAGHTTAIIESTHVGGCCVNEGCTPTKTMVASARVAYLTKRGTDYGVHYDGNVTVDMTKVRQRKRDIVNSFRNGSQSRIESTENLILIFGMASFTGPKTFEVKLNSGEMQEISGDKIFINVGCRPSYPDVPGLDKTRVLNSTSIMELDYVPEHLIVLGGGYIGLEFGQMFRRFGSAVTVVARGQLLGREDKDVAEAVAKVLEEDGIEVLLHTDTLEVKENGSDKIEVRVKTADGERTITGSDLLVATGRIPNTDWLNTDAAGLQVDKGGYIHVNDKLETNVEGIWALGDVKGGPAFTHISYDDFRIIRTNFIENGNTSITDRLVPYTVFIDPQLGRVGLSESEARQQGRKIKIAKMPMDYVARALEMDESRGFMKAIVDAENDQILGFTILGIEGGEIMSQIQIAMMGKLEYTVLQNAIFAHPTLAESLNNLFGFLE